MVYGIAERRMRARLAEQQETFPNQINQPTSTPTLRWIFQLVSGINRIKIATDEQVSYVIEGITELKQQIILLFGETVASIYQIGSIRIFQTVYCTKNIDLKPLLLLSLRLKESTIEKHYSF